MSVQFLLLHYRTIEKEFLLLAAIREFGPSVEPRSKHDNGSDVAHIWPRAVVNGKTISAPPNESGAKKRLVNSPLR